MWQKEKPEEIDELDAKTVFTIKHSDIPQGITQCVKHSWVKHSENEIRCVKCPTVNIIDSKHLNEYLNG